MASPFLLEPDQPTASPLAPMAEGNNSRSDQTYAAVISKPKYGIEGHTAPLTSTQVGAKSFSSYICYEPPKQSPVVRLNNGSMQYSPFKVLKQWEAEITSVGVDSFWARLSDASDPLLDVEEVELAIDEIAPADRQLLVEGAVFYWTLGQQVSKGGTVRRVSEIRMRRDPVWSQHTLAYIDRQAEELAKSFVPHDS